MSTPARLRLDVHGDGRPLVVLPCALAGRPSEGVRGDTPPGQRIAGKVREPLSHCLGRGRLAKPEHVEAVLGLVPCGVVSSLFDLADLGNEESGRPGNVAADHPLISSVQRDDLVNLVVDQG